MLVLGLVNAYVTTNEIYVSPIIMIHLILMLLIPISSLLVKQFYRWWFY